MTLKTHCRPSYIIRLSSNRFLWLQVLVGTQRLPKPLFSPCTRCMVTNLLNQLSTGIRDMQSTAAVVMDQRLGVIQGNMTSTCKITLETSKSPSPYAGQLTPSLLVSLRSSSAYSCQRRLKQNYFKPCQRFVPDIRSNCFHRWRKKACSF